MHARLAFRALAAVALSALTASAVQAQASAQQAPQVSVTGVVYTQYQYSDAPIPAKSTFDMTRAYVNVLGRFANGITTRVTTDVLPNGVGGNYVIRLKYAFAAWTPTGSSLTYKLGMIHTPWVDFEETLWDYRMQGTIAVDRNQAMTSSDVGFGVDGKWNSDQVNAQFVIVNGEGYSGGSGDFRKDVEGRVSFRISPTNDNSRVGGLRVSGYAGIGKFTTTGADRNRFLGMLSYRTTQYTVAGEYVSVKNFPGAAPATGSIISAFGVYHLTGGKVSVIGRVDILDPDNNVASNSTTRIIGGASYQLSPNVRMLADLDRSKLSGATAINQFLIQAQFVF